MEAVLDLPATAQETDWLEWKSTLDLRSKRDRANIARHIIAFANRTLTAAAPHCGGYGYIVVGAAPQELSGLTPVDSAELDQGLGTYLGFGDEAPQWSLEWVMRDDTPVLVIEIAPPEQGMLIYCAQSSLDGVVDDGRVYVRRQGTSAPARAPEIRALERRLTAKAQDDSLSVEVDVRRDGDAGVPRWKWDTVTDDAIIQDARDEAAGWRRASGMGAFVERPTRAQLTEYADELEEVAYFRAVTLACGQPGAAVDVLLGNPTDRPFHGVQVTMRIAGVLATNDDDPPPLPLRPSGGLQIPSHFLNAADNITPAIHAHEDPQIVVNPEGATVVWDPVDLRPGATEVLPRFWMLAKHEQVGDVSHVHLEWEASALNAIGASSGVVVLPTADEATVTSGLRD